MGVQLSAAPDTIPLESTTWRPAGSSDTVTRHLAWGELVGELYVQAMGGVGSLKVFPGAVNSTDGWTLCVKLVPADQSDHTPVRDCARTRHQPVLLGVRP